MSNWLNKWRKGGPGSGPRPGQSHPHAGHASHSDEDAPGASTNTIRKPSADGYHERPSSRNPGRPRSGVRPSDLYPERKPKHWLSSWLKSR